VLFSLSLSIYIYTYTYIYIYIYIYIFYYLCFYIIYIHYHKHFLNMLHNILLNIRNILFGWNISSVLCYISNHRFQFINHFINTLQNIPVFGNNFVYFHCLLSFFINLKRKLNQSFKHSPKHYGPNTLQYFIVN